jgi:hypothetical protein
MDARGDTVRTVEPETGPDLAVMVVDTVASTFAAVASPVPFTGATAGSADSHVTLFVRFAVALLE